MSSRSPTCRWRVSFCSPPPAAAGEARQQARSFDSELEAQSSRREKVAIQLHPRRALADGQLVEREGPGSELQCAVGEKHAVAGGLKSRDGKPLSHFEIIGEQAEFVPATATIDGEAFVGNAASDTLVVSRAPVFTKEFIDDPAAAGGTVTLRLYGWEPGCLSFGRNQTALGRYDGARAADRGIDVVRRPTGGRSVFHYRELTYCVTAPANEWGGLREAYLKIRYPFYWETSRAEDSLKTTRLIGRVCKHSNVFS